MINNCVHVIALIIKLICILYTHTVIRQGDTIALQTHIKEKYLSCHRHLCDTANCGGALFEGNDWDYRCRGEVFQIYKPTPGEIRSWDLIGLYYPLQPGNWLGRQASNAKKKPAQDIRLFIMDLRQEKAGYDAIKMCTRFLPSRNEMEHPCTQVIMLCSTWWILKHGSMEKDRSKEIINALKVHHLVATSLTNVPMKSLQSLSVSVDHGHDQDTYVTIL